MRWQTIAVAVVILLAGCVHPLDPPTGPAEQTSPTTPPHADGQVVTVVEVVDGDTYHIRYQNGSTDTVRLLGIDTPEVHVETQPDEFRGVPASEQGRAWLRDWGKQASAYTKHRLEGEQVRIVTDSRADRRGYYDRLLVYVYHDGELVNRVLLAKGYARVYESSFTKRDAFAAVAERARANNTGVWGFQQTAAHAFPPISS